MMRLVTILIFMDHFRSLEPNHMNENMTSEKLNKHVNVVNSLLAFSYFEKAHFEQIIPMPTPCKTGALLKALGSCIYNTF